MTQSSADPSVSISTTKTGFYKGFNVSVAAIPKVVIFAFILWIGLSPERAGEQLAALQTWSTSSFGGWYVYVTALFTVTCLAIAVWPRTGKLYWAKKAKRQHSHCLLGCL